MAKKFLDYDGLDHYDSKIKAFIESGLNDTLQEALSTFSGALIPRGVIKNIGATSIDLRTPPYNTAKMGDTYFVADDGLDLTYIDTSGNLTPNPEFDEDPIPVELGDAVICMVSAVISSSGVVTKDAQWAILQTNWSVKTYPSARIEPGASQTTVTLAEVGGQTIQVQVAPSSTIASNMRDSLGDLGFVALQKGSKASENITTSITKDSQGELVPTDKAVYDFVTSYAPSSGGNGTVTGITVGDQVPNDIILNVHKGEDYDVVRLPAATTSYAGVMTGEDKENLDKAVKAVSFRYDDTIGAAGLDIEYIGKNADFNNIPVATQKYDGAMSSEDKVKLDGLPTGSTIASTYVSKSLANTSSSKSCGVQVALSGTMGNLKPSVTVTTGSVANSANDVVSGHAVHAALTGTVYYNPITNAEIDALF